MADKSVPQNIGGQYAGAVAGNQTTGQLIYTGSGRLCKLTVVTSGTATCTIYDGTDANGVAVWKSNQTHTAGTTVFDLQLPITTGIFVGNTTGSLGGVVFYSKDGAYGL